MTAPLSDLYAQVQAFIGDKSSGSLTKIKQWLNEGVQDIWIAHDWGFKRDTLRFNTEPQYTTGTITVAEGSTTLTIVGGSLTGKEGWKFCSAIGEPYFRISEVAANGLTATLEAAFTEDSLSGAEFVLFKDEYDLGDSVESIEALTLLRSGYPRLDHVDLDFIERFDSVPNEVGVPLTFSLVASGDTNVWAQLSPIPDAAYPVDVKFMRRPVPMTSDDDVPSLPDAFIPLIVAYAHYKAGLYDKSVTNAQLAWQEYRTGLATKITQMAPRTSAEFSFKPHGYRRRNGGAQPWGPWF